MVESGTVSEVKNVFNWSIPLFATLRASTHKRIFKDFQFNGDVWRMLLWPFGLDESEWVSVGLSRVTGKNISLKYQLAIIDTRDNQIMVSKGSKRRRLFKSEGKRNKLFHRRFEERRHVLERHSYLCDGALTIQCKFLDVDIPDTTEISKHRQRLLTDLTSLSDEFCDVTISVGGQSFRAHKVILSARCEFFKAMFKHNMEEKLTGEVKIQDVKSDVFESVLKFIYTGTIKEEKEKEAKSETVTCDIMLAAERFQLLDLKDHCADNLINQLTVSNVAALLVCFDSVNAEAFKTKALQWICESNDRLAEVMETDGFKKLPASDLAQLLSIARPSKKRKLAEYRVSDAKKAKSCEGLD